MLKLLELKIFVPDLHFFKFYFERKWTEENIRTQERGNSSEMEKIS
jgi:hypothetical protein